MTSGLVWTLALGAAAAADDDAPRRQLAALVEMTAAVNAGDAARYARLYAVDAEIVIVGSGVLQGRAAIEAHEVRLLDEFPGARLGFHDVWQQGLVAVVHYAVAGRTASGREMGHEGLLFYRFDAAGQIREERRYLDSLTPMAQLGALGERPAREVPTVPETPRNHVASGSGSEAVNRLQVVAMLAAADAGDRAAFLAHFAPGATLDELVLPRPFAGPEAAARWFDAWSGAFHGTRTEITTAHVIGDHVLLEGVVSGSMVGALGPVAATGQPFRARRAWIVRLSEGRVVRLTAFMNGRELASASSPPAH